MSTGLSSTRLLWMWRYLSGGQHSDFGRALGGCSALFCGKAIKQPNLYALESGDVKGVMQFTAYRVTDLEIPQTTLYERMLGMVP